MTEKKYCRRVSDRKIGIRKKKEGTINKDNKVQNISIFPDVTEIFLPSNDRMVEGQNKD